MKQLLFILLFPCLALAQYQGNGNQKITLGEQTSADGLVYRGNAADTLAATLKITKTNKQDTSTYLLLDTINNVLLKYNIATTYWTRLNLLPTDTASMLGNYWRSGRFSGVLPVANGGTNRTTMPAGYILHGDGTSVDTSSQLFWDRTNRRLLFNTTTTTTGEIIMNASANTHANSFVQIFTDNNVAKGYNGYCGQNGHLLNEAVSGDMVFRSNLGRYLFGTFQSGGGDAFTALCIANNRNIGIGTVSPAVQFHTTGAVRFATFAGGGTTTLSVDNTGNLARTSSIELKKDVTPINYGLNEILQIKPINFNWIDEDKFGNENENGFIAEDVMSIIPNVVAADTHGLFMDYTKLIPILTKAIQEQQALIKALEQRILNLENK